MGIIIAAAGALEPGRFPVPIAVTLICDEARSLLCAGEQAFSAGGFIESHSAAMRAGWLERDSSAGRAWVCPACSGKKNQ
jgi:hypothetical protein